MILKIPDKNVQKAVIASSVYPLLTFQSAGATQGKDTDFRDCCRNSEVKSRLLFFRSTGREFI